VVPGAERLNGALLEIVQQRRSIEPGIKVSNENGWHSLRDFFQREEAPFKALAAHVTAALTQAAKQQVPAFDLATHDIEGEGWVNVNGKGAFNTPHNHVGYHWSGCYYVHVPAASSKSSGVIEFLDPRGTTGMPADLKAPAFAPKFQVRPKSGLLLIFPAYLQHWVYPNQDDDDRVSIAFNARIVPRTRRRPQRAIAAARPVAGLSS
jgi:uncharacterized protein (TIGR02466 family)